MAFHKDLVGLDLHIAKAHTGAVSPIGVVTPSVVGEFYLDTVSQYVYVAYDVTNTSWINVSAIGAGDMFRSVYDAANKASQVTVVADIADNLTTSSGIVPLSAKQGKALNDVLNPLATELGSFTGIVKDTAGTLSQANPISDYTPGVMSQSGDMIYGGTAGAAARLPKGVDGQALLTASGVPTWTTLPGGGDMLLGAVQEVTAAKTFDDGTVKLKGATSGTTTIKATDVSTNGTVTLPTSGKLVDQGTAMVLALVFG